MFARVIDNQVNYVSPLIEDFQNPNKIPQIAVSVDMLDTGIDIPEVLNLVFFKPVKSKIKFWQMIGRGTRLCKNLFGIDKHKQQFYIFDCCRNFEFFEENARGIEVQSVQSLTEKIYNLKLDLIVELENINYQLQEEYKNYREELVKEFLKKITELNTDSFIVRNKAVYVDKFSNPDNWKHIDNISYIEIRENIIPILLSEDSDELAKRSDNLVHGLQVEPEYWKKSDFFEIEKTRTILRELMKYIDNPPRGIYTVDIRDELKVSEKKEGYNIQERKL